MDCEYVLICKWGSIEIQHPIHGCTPQEAEETARLIIKTYQSQNVRSLPFAPEIVEAKLYRCVKELSGAEFVKTTRGEPYVDPNLEITIPQD